MAMVEDERFDVTVTRGDPAVVAVTGAVDAASVERLADALDATDDAAMVVLDLAQVTLLDSVALARLVQLITEADGRGITVAVGQTSRSVERVAALDPHAHASSRRGPYAG